MPTDHLSATFAALSDPTRRAILGRLAAGELSVTELARPFRMTLPGVSKHLRVLERAGLIEQGRRAQWRPCRLKAAPLREVAEWVEEYRRYWEESLDRLDEYLQEMNLKGTRRQERKDVTTPGRRAPAARSTDESSGRKRGAWRGRTRGRTIGND